MDEKPAFAKFASEDEAVLSDAKDSDLVSVNLFNGSVIVYKPNLIPRGMDVPSCYPLGSLGKLRAAPTPSLLVSSVRAFIFVIEPPAWNYAVISDPSLPESVQADTSFFPAALSSESDGKWTMEIVIRRFQKLENIRQVHRSTYFHIVDDLLFSPSGQNITSLIESFRIGEDPLRILVSACKPNEAVSRMTLAELKKLERAINNLSMSDWEIDMDKILPEDPFL